MNEAAELIKPYLELIRQQEILNEKVDKEESKISKKFSELTDKLEKGEAFELYDSMPDSQLKYEFFLRLREKYLMKRDG